METSSARWRCDRPPIVFDGEIRQSCRTLLTFTRPYFGTARSMSKTFAVSTNSGGSSSSEWMLARPALRSRFSAARLVLISFARWSASMRWTRERSGAAVVGLAGVFVAGGMGGESTALRAADKTPTANSSAPEVEVHRYGGDLTPNLTVCRRFLDTFIGTSSVQAGSPGALDARAHRPAGPGRTRSRRRPDLRPHAGGRRRDGRTVPHPCPRWGS